MRKCDIEEVEAFLARHGVAFQDAKDLYNLCASIYTSGFVDGSNAYFDAEEDL